MVKKYIFIGLALLVVISAGLYFFIIKKPNTTFDDSALENQTQPIPVSLKFEPNTLSEVYYGAPCGTGCHSSTSMSIKPNSYSYKLISQPNSGGENFEISCKLKSEIWKSINKKFQEVSTSYSTKSVGTSLTRSCNSDRPRGTCFTLKFTNNSSYFLLYDQTYHTDYLGCLDKNYCPENVGSFFMPHKEDQYYDNADVEIYSSELGNYLDSLLNIGKTRSMFCDD